MDASVKSDTCPCCCCEMGRELDRLKAENARLREALDLAYAEIERLDRCRAKAEGGG